MRKPYPVQTESNGCGNAESTAATEALTTIAVNGDPATYEEAIYRELWQEAIREECGSIIRNKTLNILTQTASSTKPIGSKWVFRTKRNPDGIIRYKVRLVIKGYMQTNWGETVRF